MKSTRTGQTRRPLARIHLIHEALLSGSWPNCSSLADQLEVSTKTILRDLDFMRDEFCLPIEFAPERNGYHYTAPVESFPPFQVPKTKTASFSISTSNIPKTSSAGSSVGEDSRKSYPHPFCGNSWPKKRKNWRPCIGIGNEG